MIAAASLCLALLAWSCARAEAIGELRFIGEQRIAHRTVFKNTVVGGLSGLDYDPRSGEWILASDDRSDVSPARFYTARLAYDAKAFGRVTLLDVTSILKRPGTAYRSRLRADTPPDMEAIRYDPLDGSIWYADEGDRLLGVDPSLRRMARDGSPLQSLPAPPGLRMRWLGASGPRNNQAYEGLAFSPDGVSMWVSMESSLRQDGPVPTPGSGSLARFSQFDRSGALLRQVAYAVDAIPARPGKGRFADNGVSAILAAGDALLLVVERAAVQDDAGKYRNYIRLYEADLSGATDVVSLETLKEAQIEPVRKRLLLDLNTLDLPRLDNIEGLAWGPVLDNGHASLVMVSDDNFNPAQVTQLLAFEVLPARQDLARD